LADPPHQFDLASGGRAHSQQFFGRFFRIEIVEPPKMVIVGRRSYSKSSF
jgi:hypothetical protein